VKMDEQKKEQIKAEMKEYLSSFGWPDCANPNEVVMTNLQGMFKVLLQKGLVSYTDYDSYLVAAEFQYALNRTR